MQETIDAGTLLSEVETLPSIAALQQNTGVTGGYVYITNIGFYYGNPTLTGLSATPDNNIVVDKKGIRWVFQPQLVQLSSSDNPTFNNVQVNGTLTTVGTTTLKDGLNVSAGATTLSGNLNILGTTIFTGGSIESNLIIAATVTVGTNPWGVAITPNGSYAYVTNYSSANVSVIATATNTVVATVTVGANPWGVAITPNGSYVYVANNGSSDVSVIEKILTFSDSTINVAENINIDGLLTAATATVTGNSTVDGTLTAGTATVTGNSTVDGILTAGGIHNKGYAYINNNSTELTTTSTTYTATGYGIVYTPVSTGNILVKTSGLVSNNTIGDGVYISLGYAAGTALIAAGTVLSLTTITGMGITFTQEGLGSNYVPYNLDQVITGLTVGTSYIFETGIQAIGGGTVSDYLQYMSVTEI